MRILIDSDNSDGGNLGDVAMLQAAVGRLDELWPGATLEVLTGRPDLLALHAPRAHPLPALSRYSCFGPGYVTGAARTRLPARLAADLTDAKRALGIRWPHALAPVIAVRSRLKGPRIDAAAFFGAVETADLLLVSGMGAMTDSAARHSHLVLDTIELALRAHVPVAMASQGIGPLADPVLARRMQAVLPHVDLVMLREGRHAPHLLAELGVPPGRLVITGDDAVEAAHAARPPELGEGLGVNLRVARYADVDGEDIATLRAAVEWLVAAEGAPVVPLPITRHAHAADSTTIRAVLAGVAPDSDGGAALATVPEVIAQAGRCRVVVTGAYHAAVFALAQGVPTVCLARAPYYRQKFEGLADLFGEGCRLVDLGGPDAPRALVEALERQWLCAEAYRPGLLEAARGQVLRARAAYARLGALPHRRGETVAS